MFNKDKTKPRNLNVYNIRLEILFSRDYLLRFSCDQNSESLCEEGGKKRIEGRLWRLQKRVELVQQHLLAWDLLVDLSQKRNKNFLENLQEATIENDVF